MHIDEDAIRRRAFRIWEAEGRPPGRYDEFWQRARDDIEGEFRRVTGHVGAYDRLSPPLYVEEATSAGHRDIGRVAGL
jgi:hypothetical protein